ncbi:MAG: energy transducer TonB [bacterium]
MKAARLLFDWPHRHRIHLLPPFLFVLAALAHAGIFFLFSVSNPPVGRDGLNPARVYFLGEGSPKLAELESTLSSNDPALFAPRPGAPVDLALTANHIPTYASGKTALLNMPPRARPIETTSASSGPVNIPASQRSMPAPPPADLNRLSSSELADRLPPAPAGSFVSKNPADSWDDATFFVGIRSDGSLAHIVTGESSGNAALDLEALRALKTVSFIPVQEAPLAWGFVRFHFGKAPVQP